MRLITQTHSDNEYHNAGCDFAIVEITKEVAEQILKRKKVFLEMQAKDENLRSFTFSSSVASFYEDDGEMQEPIAGLIEKKDELNGFAVVPEDVDLDFLNEASEEPYHDDKYLRAVSDVMCISQSHFWWTHYAESCSVETECLSYDVLNQVL